MKSIREKESEDVLQMQPIRDQMFALLAPLNPRAVRRGRHGHSSAQIEISGTTGLIDVQMATRPWDDMPDAISAAYPMELWAYAYITVDRSRGSKYEMYWELPFEDLGSNLKRFILLAVEFISELTSDEFTIANRAPTIKPDRLPNLKGARPVKIVG